MVAIQISLTTSGTVFTSKRFLRISEILMWITFEGAVNNMSSINAAVEGLVADAVITSHTGYVAMAELSGFRN